MKTKILIFFLLSALTITSVQPARQYPKKHYSQTNTASAQNGHKNRQKKAPEQTRSFASANVQQAPQYNENQFKGLDLPELDYEQQPQMQQPQSELQTFWQQHKKEIIAVLAALGIGTAAVAGVGVAGNMCIDEDGEFKKPDYSDWNPVKGYPKLWKKIKSSNDDSNDSDDNTESGENNG